MFNDDYKRDYLVYHPLGINGQSFNVMSISSALFTKLRMGLHNIHIFHPYTFVSYRPTVMVDNRNMRLALQGCLEF